MMGMGLAGGDTTHGGFTTAASTSGKVLIVISGTIFNATAIADGAKFKFIPVPAPLPPTQRQ